MSTDMAVSTAMAVLVARYITGRHRRAEVAESTTRRTRVTLRTFVESFGRRPVERLGKHDVERWREARRHVKPSTLCTEWSTLSSFFDWLVDERVVVQNPCRKMKRPPRPELLPRALDKDQVLAVLAVAPDTRARAIIWLMLGCGLRGCEVSRLNIEQWSRRSRLLVKVHGKRNRLRDVPLYDDVERALNEYLAEWPASSGPFIRSYVGAHDRMQARTYSTMLSNWMYAAGVKHAPWDGVSGHALRHTCASDVLDESGDLLAVQELLGHKHLETTRIYLRPRTTTQIRTAMAARRYTPVQWSA